MKLQRKWGTMSFENKVNIVLLSIALISCLISLGGFWYYCSYSYRDNGFYNQWLIASFISALFIGIWYYLNYQRFTVEQCKKYGVIFIVAGFLSLISPFIAIALLIEGTIMLKKVFTNSNSQESIKPQEKTINIAVQESIDINPRPADQPKMSKIEEVWNFLDFAKKMGQPKRAALTNNETGEKYAALMFPTPQGDREFTMVAFSSDLGELTAKEIVDRKDELYVVKLETGNYYLCDNKSLQVDNCDINSLQLWIDGSLKDLQSVYLKDTLTSEQQLQAVIYLVSLLCYKPNAPTEQIIKYVSTKYSIPENILSQYIKDYRYYRTLLAEDILGYTSMVVCKLCIYKPETSLEQIVVLGKDNNLQKILNKFPQHKVITNNIAICSEHDINNDTIPNNGTLITRSLSIYLDEFEQITIGLAYSMEILK